MSAEHFTDKKPFPTRSLYVHIPFCAGRCAYCDFFSVPRGSCSPSTLASYVSAVLEQAAEWTQIFEAGEFVTIYIGGGTPTVLGTELLGTLVRGLEPYAANECEWTIEANPESLDEEAVQMLAETKVSRISLGVQTLSQSQWPILGRVGSIEDSLRAIELLGSSRFEVSVDLLAGIPYRASDAAGDPEYIEAQLLESLSALSGKVPHISMYDLTIEEGTVLQRRIVDGELVLPDTDSLARARESADGLLAAHGYIRYEVSNYALPGHECRHNLAYWNMDPYLGLGSGAVSTLAYPADAHQRMLGSMVRLNGTKNLKHFIARPADIPPEVEIIDKPTAAFEVLMMGFRTARGVDATRFSALFGIPILELIPSSLERWGGEIIQKDNHIAIHPRSFDILNRFLVECLEEMDENRAMLKT